MRAIFFIALAVFISACVAQRGGYQQINLQNPPSDFLLAKQYVEDHYQNECFENGNVEIATIQSASYQIVAGKNYKITFTLQNEALLNVKVFQSLPNSKGLVRYEIDDCSN